MKHLPYLFYYFTFERHLGDIADLPVLMNWEKEQIGKSFSYTCGISIFVKGTMKRRENLILKITFTLNQGNSNK